MATRLSRKTPIGSNSPEVDAKTLECLEAPRYTCALGGALGTVLNIHRAVPILHSGTGCGMNQNFFSYGSGYQGVGYIGGMITPSTNISEKEVVFGGEGRLREQIQATLDLIDGDIFVVLTGCIPSMIGDDVDSVVKEFRAQGHPIINISTSGFGGNTFHGYELFMKAVATQLLEKTDTVKGLVNIFGVVPYQDVFWRGNLKEIKRVLEEIGLSVNTLIGDFGGVDNLKKIPSAELNIVLSPWVGVETAEIIKTKFDIPYVVMPAMPVGPFDTSRFIRKIGEVLDIEQEAIDSVLSEEERNAYQELDISGDMTTMLSSSLPFAVVANSATALGITRFLANEAGFTPTAIIINDNPPHDARERIAEELRNLESGLTPNIAFEVDSYKIREELKKSDFKLLLASSIEKYFASDIKAGHLSVSFPAYDRLVVGRSYAGYRGGTTLLEDILSKYLMPF